MLEVALAPVHLGALIGEDAGHPDAASAARWLRLAQGSMPAEEGQAQVRQGEDSSGRKNLLGRSPVAPGRPGSGGGGGGRPGHEPKEAGTAQAGRGWVGQGPPLPAHWEWEFPGTVFRTVIKNDNNTESAEMRTLAGPTLQTGKPRQRESQAICVLGGNAQM